LYNKNFHICILNGSIIFDILYWRDVINANKNKYPISKQYLSSMELGYEPISRHHAQAIKELYGLEVI